MQHDGADKTVTFDSTEGYIREVVYPIDGGLVGYFRIGLSERPMMQLMWKRFVQTMLVILAICLAASVLATRYARAFLRPVQTLAQAIRQIGRGNYSVRVPVETKDEVGRLAKAFNVMSNRLAVKDRENSKLLTACGKRRRPVFGSSTSSFLPVKTNGAAFRGNCTMRRASPWYRCWPICGSSWTRQKSRRSGNSSPVSAI